MLQGSLAGPSHPEDLQEPKTEEAGSDKSGSELMTKVEDVSLPLELKPSSMHEDSGLIPLNDESQPISKALPDLTLISRHIPDILSEEEQAAESLLASVPQAKELIPESVTIAHDQVLLDPMAVGKELSPEPMAMSKELSPEPVAVSKELSPDPVVASKELSPEPMAVSKGLSPEPVAVSKGLSPEPVAVSKGLSPEPVAVSKGLSPEPVAVSKGLSPEPVVVSKELSPEPVAVSKELSPEPVAVSKELSPEPVAVSKGLSPEPVAVSKELSPEPVAVSKELSPEPVAVSRLSPEPVVSKELSPEPVAVGKELSPEPVVVSKELSPEPVTVGKELSPEPMAVSKELSPEPVAVSRLSPEPVVSKELSPEPVAVSKELSPEPVAVSKQLSPESVAVSKELSPEPVAVSKELSPEPVAVSKELSPEPVAVSKQLSPEPVAVSKELSPEPVAVSKELSPEPVAVSKVASKESSPEPVAVSKELSPEPVAVSKELLPEPVAVSKELSPEPVAVSKELLPEPVAVSKVASKESSPEPVAVSKELSPEPVAVSKELSPEPVAVKETSEFVPVVSSEPEELTPESAKGEQLLLAKKTSPQPVTALESLPNPDKSGSILPAQAATETSILGPAHGDPHPEANTPFEKHKLNPQDAGKSENKMPITEPFEADSQEVITTNPEGLSLRNGDLFSVSTQKYSENYLESGISKLNGAHASSGGERSEASSAQGSEVTSPVHSDQIQDSSSDVGTDRSITNNGSADMEDSIEGPLETSVVSQKYDDASLEQESTIHMSLMSSDDRSKSKKRKRQGSMQALFTTSRKSIKNLGRGIQRRTKSQLGKNRIKEKEASPTLMSPVMTQDWDPTCLLEELYSDFRPSSRGANITGESARHYGYLEKLPKNATKSSVMKGWRRRYFRVMDDKVYYYEDRTSPKALGFVRLSISRIILIPEKNQIQIQEKEKGGQSMMLKACDKEDMTLWHRALLLEAAHPTPTLPLPDQETPSLLIIDIGAASVRAGFGGSNAYPEMFFPAVASIDADTYEAISSGNPALLPDNRYGAYQVYPRKHNLRMDKHDSNLELKALECIISMIVTDLDVEPQSIDLLLTFPPTVSQDQRDNLVEILFEVFQFSAICFQNQSLLSLYSYNTTSGIVVNIGDHIDIMPIIDGYAMEAGMSHIPHGGNAITENLSKIVTHKGIRYFSETEMYIVRLIKEELCYISQDFDGDLAKCESNLAEYTRAIDLDRFQLPDHRKVIALDVECFKAPEGLFRPSMWGKDVPGIHELVWKAIQACPIDQRREMSRKIYLSGGSTVLPGLLERLQKEVSLLSTTGLTIEVHSAPSQQHAAFLGASVLATLGSFQDYLVTREEFNTLGFEALKKWNTF